MARPHPRLSADRVRAGYFLLTALNTLASSYYLNYLFFYLHDRFGFSNRDNLLVSACYGLIYAGAAWPCGRFAERHGYARTAALGFGLLALCMVASGVLNLVAPDSALGLVGVLVIYSIVLLLTWPALEAVTTAHVPAARVPHLVGIYNATWSSGAAVSYFTGGALYEAFGSVAVFWLPAAMFAAQFIAARWLAPHERASAATPGGTVATPAADADVAHASNSEPDTRPFTPSVPPETFRTLAWVASPFSYVAIFTLLPIIPGIALRLGLSPSETGVICSVWMFARMATFLGLWHWSGWHYRFRWLLAAMGVLIVSFGAVLLAPSVTWLVAAQIVFGLAIGLIYYSSLFYSMDVGHARAEHGGIHEAVIGVGSFAGPAVGALALFLVPRQIYAGAIAVSGLLAIGLGAMGLLWRRTRRRR